MALVEDVALAVLDEEEHAGGVAEGGVAVRVEGGGQASGEAFCAAVGGEFQGGPGDGRLEEGVLCPGEVAGGVSEKFTWAAVRRREPYLCSEEVRAERPPKEEAMVLNSTCLICRLSPSWWTI